VHAPMSQPYSLSSSQLNLDIKSRLFAASVDGLKNDFAAIQHAYYPRQADLVSDCPGNVSGLRTIHFMRPQRRIENVRTPRMR
jgi:hypothetical protein